MEVIIGRTGIISSTFLRHFLRFNTTKNFLPLQCLCRSGYTWDSRFFDSRQNGILPNSFFSSNLKHFNRVQHVSPFTVSYVAYSDDKSKAQSVINKADALLSKVTVFQKMKQLTKDYWHILIPVHLVTSSFWITIFYIAAKNGVDIISLMNYLHMPEKYIDMIRNSNAGHWAVTYALYKIFTPLRYTVTVGGTTMSIKYLDKRGWLKFKRPSTEATQSKQCSSKSKKESSENP